MAKQQIPAWMATYYANSTGGSTVGTPESPGGNHGYPCAA